MLDATVYVRDESPDIDQHSSICSRSISEVLVSTLQNKESRFMYQRLSASQIETSGPRIMSYSPSRRISSEAFLAIDWIARKAKFIERLPKNAVENIQDRVRKLVE